MNGAGAVPPPPTSALAEVGAAAAPVHAPMLGSVAPAAVAVLVAAGDSAEFNGETGAFAASSITLNPRSMRDMSIPRQRPWNP